MVAWGVGGLASLASGLAGWWESVSVKLGVHGGGEIRETVVFDGASLSSLCRWGQPFRWVGWDLITMEGESSRTRARRAIHRGSVTLVVTFLPRKRFVPFWASAMGWRRRLSSVRVAMLGFRGSVTNGFDASARS